MSDIDTLLGRIDAEIDSAKNRVEELRQEKLTEYMERQKRLEVFGKVCDDLAGIWKPRLDALAQRLGERAKVSPSVTPSLRQWPGCRFWHPSSVARPGRIRSGPAWRRCKGLALISC